MAQIKLSLPVVVSPDKSKNRLEYTLQPLFFPHPTATKHKYEEAEQEFRERIRAHFKGFKLTRQNQNELLWFCFSPYAKLKIVHMEFAAGKQFVRGDFAVAYFRLQEKIFVCLPKFSAFIFVAEGEKESEIFYQAREVVEKLLRQYKKDEQSNSIEIEAYVSPRGEYLTTVEFNVQIEDGDFAFEKSDMDDFFFALMGGGGDFDGGDELEKVGNNLNDIRLSKLKRAYYRDELVGQLENSIYQRENTPIVLVGAAGVGKHTLLEEVVYRYRELHSGKLPSDELLTRLWLIEPTRIIAGMSIVGMWQRRFESILQHLLKRLPAAYSHYKQGFTDKTDKILVDNPIALLRIGKSAQNSMTLSDVLKPYLEKRQLQMIMIATPEEWKVMQERDRRFADLFQVVRVAEPNYETAVKMMISLRKRLEIQHNCSIYVPALRQLFYLRRNYFQNQSLPGSIARHLHQLALKYSNSSVDVEEVQAEFSDFSGLRPEIFDNSITIEPNELEQYIAGELIGQPMAVRELSAALHTIKAKLNNPQKPLASFLFIGPTGVGKTEAAKIMCQYMLQDPRRLMRFDMNEYVDGSAISRLIGDYYNPEGQLTGRVRYQPFGVLLFDEIEKAHPKVHDLLLQVLDDARLTDSLGRTVDFSNTVIIMTSNVGAQQVGTRLGFDGEQRNDEAIYRKAVDNFFRPEFVNRIDKIVIFNNLSLDHIYDIAKLQIKQLLQRDGFVRRTTILNIAPDALRWVAQRGYDARMGGRALKRQIEKDLTTFTAEQLIHTAAEQPIIFDIQFKDGQLRPRVEPLVFVQPLSRDWLPALPQEAELRKAYTSLLQEIERIEDFISDESQKAANKNSKNSSKNSGVMPEQWHYYDYTNQISEKKEKLRRMLMGFHSSYADNITPAVFRLKNAGTSSIIYRNPSQTEGNVKRILREDYFFQKDALQEIQYVYQNAPEQFDKAQSLFLAQMMDIAYFKFIAPAAAQNKIQKYRLHIQSAIANEGKAEIEFLLEKYNALLLHLGAGSKIDAKNQCLQVEGFAIAALFEQEQGYHFFYKARQNPLPLRVWLEEDAPAKAENARPLSAVVRMYDIWLGKNHKSSTITDLRTGFTNQADIRAEEFKVLLLAALPNALATLKI
jgi:ATP-dependent Clp protease ATP-binding subunit ClpC